jgi:hypothetical protein
MSNHYHLLLELEVGGLSAGMQLLNGSFARFSNRRHGFEGHLFRNRFWSELIDEDTHLLEAARYIVLNPVRGRYLRRAGGVVVEQLQVLRRARLRTAVPRRDAAPPPFRQGAVTGAASV